MASDTESPIPPAPDPPCCSCGCPGCCPEAAWPRSVRRKVGRTEGDGGRGALGEGEGAGPVLLADVAVRVDVENEVEALREGLAGHHQKVVELCAELEQERAASASAASEAMSMILRLQREKAEVQMEARQFKRFAEEKMAHDQQELLVLEDLIYKREQALQALSCEARAYRHRLLSYGIDPDPLGPAGGVADGLAVAPPYDYPAYEYPPLRCYDNARHLDPNMNDENDVDLDKYPPGETPCRKVQLQSLEWRIHQLERTPSQVSLVSEMEKGVVVGQSPGGWARRDLQFSTESFGSPLAKVPNENQKEEFPVAVDGLSDFGGDDDNTSDRVYTIDAIHSGVSTVKMCEDHVGSPRDSVCRDGIVGTTEETDIKKLYMRLQALEADRESMRQAIISMRTEKAQLVLLKEIAQQLCRDVPPPPPPPVRKLVKRPSLLRRFSFVSAIKWIVSFVFRRKTTRQSKYMFGPSDYNVGLLLLLERTPEMKQWRYLSRIQG